MRPRYNKTPTKDKANLHPLQEAQQRGVIFHGPRQLLPVSILCHIYCKCPLCMIECYKKKEQISDEMQVTLKIKNCWKEKLTL